MLPCNTHGTELTTFLLMEMITERMMVLPPRNVEFDFRTMLQLDGAKGDITYTRATV